MAELEAWEIAVMLILFYVMFLIGQSWGYLDGLETCGARAYFVGG